MLTGEQSTLEKPEEFAHYLWEGLCELHLGTEKPFLETSELYKLFITSGPEYPLDVMTRIYEERISKEHQQAFRKSIGLALQKCAETRDPKVFGIVDELTYLIGTTKATDALDDLLHTLSNEYLAQNRPRILFATFSFLPLLVPDDIVFGFTHSVATSPQFDNGYLFAALETMMNCKADRCTEIISEFAGQIKGLYNSVKGNGKEEEAYWKEISKLSSKHPAAKAGIHALSNG